MFIDTKRSRIETDDETVQNTDTWMVTLSDIIMLMITFFVMLLTMSTINQKSLKDAINHIKKSIGGSAYHGLRGSETLGTIKAALKNIDRSIEIKEDERGIVLSIQEDILFDPGKSTIKKENYLILDAISAVIDSCPNEIMVMGHTDDLPVQDGEYESNWELSAYRGLYVLEYFVKNRRLPPERFYVGGYGAFRPLFPNNNSKHRSLNRRVEIIFKHKEV
ncbi:MAG: OmpA family protein [Proteobacteria bacterium]|nr:OmpA family protein [Pseudomonadota bacterium]